MTEIFTFIKGFQKNDSLPFLCPFCKKNSLLLDDDTWQEHDKSALHHCEEWFDPCNHVEYLYTALYKCSNKNCRQCVISSGTGGVDIDYSQEEYADAGSQPAYYSYYQPKIFIPPLSFFTVPEKTPSEIKALLELSFSIVLQSPASAVNCLRSSLEKLLDIYSIPEKKLHLRIEQDVPTHVILSPYKDYLMAIKWLGNSGSHDLDEITLQDIMDVYEIMEFVLGNLYGNVQNTLQKAQLINQKKGPLTRQERKSLGS